MQTQHPKTQKPVGKLRTASRTSKSKAGLDGATFKEIFAGNAKAARRNIQLYIKRA